MELACVVATDDYNTNLGDLMLDESGYEVVLTDLAQEVAQRLTVRFKFFKGEWFLNLESGTPWLEAIMRKGANDALVRSVLTQLLLTTQGVANVRSLAYSINRQREMSIVFSVVLTDGSVFRSSDFRAYEIVL